jgi:anti-sigma B factor antagonist
MTTTTEVKAPPLTPIVAERPTAVRVEIKGSLIVGNRQAFKQRVLDLLAEGKREFVIDFKQCGYIDNSGLGVLVAISKRIREAGGELVLEDLNDDLVTLFELTKLDDLFTIRSSRT